MKNGQGLPLTVIVIALVCLIVLVVLIAIFSGKIKIFGKTASSCTSKGGACSSGSPDAENGGCVGKVYIPATDCETDGKGVCCVSI